MDLLAKEKDIAMLILDIMMPKKDGFHVLKEIREQRNLPGYHFISKDNR